MPATSYRTELDRLFDRIRSYMDKHRMSQSELAKKAGVRQATVSEMLSPEYEHSPKWDTLNRLAKACEITLRFDLGDDDPLDHGQ